jgi:hypothetical protein
MLQTNKIKNLRCYFVFIILWFQLQLTLLVEIVDVRIIFLDCYFLSWLKIAIKFNKQKEILYFYEL